ELPPIDVRAEVAEAQGTGAHLDHLVQSNSAAAVKRQRERAHGACRVLTRAAEWDVRQRDARVGRAESDRVPAPQGILERATELRRAREPPTSAGRPVVQVAQIEETDRAGDPHAWLGAARTIEDLRVRNAPGGQRE